MSLATQLARRLVSSERAYHQLRRAQLLGMWAMRRPHERDFAYFRRLDGRKGLFIDVGANSGQSAISFSLYNRGFDILSFEPCRQLEPSLRFARRLLGKRYRYELFGLSDVNGSATLFVPVLGTLPLLARASTDRNVLDGLVDELQARYERPVTVKSFDIQLRVFDDLKLSPDVVKIDVEGIEPRVLRGMKQTLERSRPLLLIEKSGSFDECADVLRGLAYEFFTYQPGSGDLVPLGHDGVATNFFALPAEGGARGDTGSAQLGAGSP